MKVIDSQKKENTIVIDEKSQKSNLDAIQRWIEKKKEKIDF